MSCKTCADTATKCTDCTSPRVYDSTNNLCNCN